MKNRLSVLLGVVGAVVGYVGTLLLLELVGFGNKQDPIQSGILALVVFGPIGAVIGLLLGTKLGRLMRASDSTGGAASSNLKALGIVVASVAVVGVGYYVYDVSTATPWLNPNAATPLLQFEVRLPAGAAMPASSRDVEVELQTNLNRMPGELRSSRRDGDRAVIVGDVELAFRTPTRHLSVKIAGQQPRLYRIGLTDKAPHSPALGPWQPLTDGSEIRYRAKWPGM